MVPVASIRIVEGFNARNLPDTDESEEGLTASMARDGLLQPIVVVPSEGGEDYELVSGERRLRGARALGWEQIAVTVRERGTDLDRKLLMLAENEYREDLDPIDLAFAYERILREHPELTRQGLAQKLGIAQTVVYSRLSALKIPWVREVLQRKLITVSVAGVLQRLFDDQGQEIVPGSFAAYLRWIGSAHPSTEAVRKAVQLTLGNGTIPGLRRPRPLLVRAQRHASTILRRIDDLSAEERESLAATYEDIVQKLRQSGVHQGPPAE